MIEFFPFSNKMETTEDEAMKDVMGLLETEPSESDHREQLAILVASGNCKEMLGVQLTQEQIKRLTKKDVEKYFKRYEASLSSKTCDAIVDTFIQLSCRGLAYFLPIDRDLSSNSSVTKFFKIIFSKKSMHSETISFVFPFIFKSLFCEIFILQEL